MSKKFRSIGIVVVLSAAFVMTNANADQPESVGNGNRVQLEPGMHPVVITPARAGELVPNKNSGAMYYGTANETPITYTYNNPVINNPKVALIWYGSWNADSATQSTANKPVARDYFNFTNQFVADFAANARWSLNKSYYSVISGTTLNIGAISGVSNYWIKRNDAKYGKTLSQSSILKIATDSLGGKTQDNNTIYLVLTSSDIAVNGFNAGRVQFCGWHSAVSSTAPSMKYGFVGDSANATYCQGQTGVSPNNNPGADAMMSVLAHEIEEAATDPYVTGVVWRDSSGMENADKCAWTWGTLSTADATTGALYNWQGQSGAKYLIQQGFKLVNKTQSSGKDTWSGQCANS